MKPKKLKNKKLRSQNKFEKKMEKEKKKEEDKKKKRSQMLLTDKRGAIGARPYITNMIIVAGITMSIMLFVIFYLEANAPANPLITNLTSSVNTLNTTIGQFQTTTTNAVGSMANASANPVGFVFLIFQGAFDIPKLFFSMMTTVPTVLTTTLFPSLALTGLGSIIGFVLSLVSAIMLVTLVFLFIKVIRSGESER